MKKVIALVIGLLALVGCTGGFIVSDAEVTDIVSNTEKRQNGFAIVWVRYDTTAGYCVRSDSDLYQKAQEYREQAILVTIKYEGIRAGDSDGYNWLNSGGCDTEREGIEIYRLVSIEPAKTGATPSASQ